MTKPRSGGPRAATKQPSQPSGALEWQKWTTELPPETVMALKVRAATERRPMREVLRDAILTYVETAVRS